MVEAARKKESFEAAFEKYYLSARGNFLRQVFTDVRRLRGFLDLPPRFDLVKIVRRLANLKKWGYPSRALKTIDRVEKFYGKKLDGDLVLFFGFDFIDGYTRFEKGRNTIFLGVDYSEADADYLNILLAHELNHLTRDSSEAVLNSYGANGKMTNKEYIDKMTFAEHLVNEGLAGYFSSVIYPGFKPWQYLYYSKKQYDWCVANHNAIKQLVKQYVLANKSWHPFYREDLLGKKSPERLQYYLGLELIKEASKKCPLKELTFMPSKKIIEEFL